MRVRINLVIIVLLLPPSLQNERALQPKMTISRRALLGILCPLTDIIFMVIRDFQLARDIGIVRLSTCFYAHFSSSELINLQISLYNFNVQHLLGIGSYKTRKQFMNIPYA